MTDDRDPVHLCEYCVRDVKAILAQPARIDEYCIDHAHMGGYYLARSKDGYNIRLAPGATLVALLPVETTQY